MIMRWPGRLAGLVAGLAVLFLVQTWVWWQGDPRSGGTDSNALWARHQWVGQAHTDAEYRALAALLRENRIGDVFFHAGPLEPDGSVPPGKYAYAGSLVKALRKYAPGVRAQAYLGQLRGRLHLEDPAVRAGILRTDGAMLDAGFDGIHYDIEPIFPEDTAFLGLLDQTRAVTRPRGALLSVALEQLTTLPEAQPILRRIPGDPPRPTPSYLRAVAARVDQVAIMTYDVNLPTQSLVGRHYAWHTEQTLKLIGDQVTVFMGVPTYRPDHDWGEDLATALRGVRKGLDDLDRPPARPYGVGVYADWTTSPAEWARYRALWPTTSK